MDLWFRDELFKSFCISWLPLVLLYGLLCMCDGYTAVRCTDGSMGITVKWAHINWSLAAVVRVKYLTTDQQQIDFTA